MGEKRSVYRLLVGNPKGKKPLGRSRRRGVDNLADTGWRVVDRMYALR
jgi:hypothetical protein